MAKHPKHLHINTPAFAANLAQLQSPHAHPYQRQQVAQLVYASCYPYVEQQSDLYAEKAASLGIEQADLAQGAALKLWEYVSSLNSAAPLTPKAVVLNVYNLVRDEMIETCKAGSGAVYIETSAEQAVRAEERRLAAFMGGAIHQSQREKLLEYTKEELALAQRYVGYEANAKKPALRLDDVQAPVDGRIAPVDEEAMMDGVFDTPTQGAAELMRTPQLLPEDEVGFRQQQKLLLDFVRDKLPARDFAILSKRYGLEDERNQEMSLVEVARSENVTATRVRDIETRAINRLRHHLGRQPELVKGFMAVLRSE